ncbi:ATP-binding protein [Streptomyces sp. NPDC051286]|uniref:ATP-binding protein n=1 Tax=Streptomyces sp. NPDC051286 TaxID=3365647 RepID=UPI0037BD2880
MGLPEEVIDDAEPAASELVTNATEHAVGPYKMVLRRTGSGLVCEVHDHDPRVPAFPQAAPDADDLHCDGNGGDEVSEGRSPRRRTEPTAAPHLVIRPGPPE